MRTRGGGAEAFENAMTLDIAMGGSTNTGLHILAAAHEAHVDFTMADIDRALFNSFRVRFELGLFDDVATQPWWKLGERDIGTDASAALNRWPCSAFGVSPYSLAVDRQTWGHRQDKAAHPGRRRAA